MELKDNIWIIDGIPVKDIVSKYGSPLYIYRASKMREQYRKLTEAFKNCGVRIHYAAKALTNINVLHLFRELGAGLDAVSIQEVWLGLKTGYKPEDIIFTPNCVSMEEIESGVREKVKINIDNISILEQFGNKYGDTIPVCVRINPHIMAGGNSKISTGHIDSKFGISIYQIPHVLRILETTGLRAEGLHMHTGSDILDVDVFLKGVEIILDTALHFNDLDYIDLGSGFKVAYKTDDIYTDIESLGETLSSRFNIFRTKYGKNISLIFEPGKFLVSEAGIFIARTNVIKQTTSTVFAGLDTGLNHLIRPMFYDAYHHIINISNPTGKTRIYTVVGYICETDTFGWNRKINEVAEGDLLAFLNAGAYCYSMSSNYNSRFRPAEVMIDNGKDQLIRKREDMEDILRNQIIPE